MDRRRVRIEDLKPGDVIVGSKNKKMIDATVISSKESFGHFYRVVHRGGANLNSVVGYDSIAYVYIGQTFLVR